IEGAFRDSDEILAGVSLDGALLDLGVSSHQLDTAERGFSYNADGALDMRMSKNGITAADLINSMSWQELADIIRKYGEEPNAALIARKIAKVRETAPIETTMQLTQAIVSALPAAVRRKDKNPARKTFQAIRIAVNDELDTLSDGLEKIFGLLKPGGRFAVITFHSLEDRIVKQYFASLQISCTCPPEYPICTCGGKAKATAITKKPITATETENEENRRARSAKLRVIEKI
ncbi:MAG: 16S rRNA (cytosine(1402)-N(4))-methyltransferase RsmH, partial [Oscillospiraceae bacterium]